MVLHLFGQLPIVEALADLFRKERLVVLAHAVLPPQHESVTVASAVDVSPRQIVVASA